MSSNPKDAIGLTKPALRLVPPALALHVSQAMADGAKKYGAYNWRKNAVRLTIYIEAALRHLYSLLDGEDCARDSGHMHAAHVAACMAIILDAYETGNLIDDRADDGCAADVIDGMTAKPAPAKPAGETLDMKVEVTVSPYITFEQVTESFRKSVENLVGAPVRMFKPEPLMIDVEAEAPETERDRNVDVILKSLDAPPRPEPRPIKVGDILCPNGPNSSGRVGPVERIEGTTFYAQYIRDGVIISRVGGYRGEVAAKIGYTHEDGAPVLPPSQVVEIQIPEGGRGIPIDVDLDEASKSFTPYWETKTSGAV